MFLAILQGVSELFPISSLGHTVLIPPLLHWHVDESDESFLAFVVVLHLGTALALLAYYRNAWVRIVRALVASIALGRLDRGRAANRPRSRGGGQLLVPARDARDLARRHARNPGAVQTGRHHR